MVSVIAITTLLYFIISLIGGSLEITRKDLFASCMNNDAKSCHMLGEFYYSGINKIKKGVPISSPHGPEINISIPFLKKACEMNSPDFNTSLDCFRIWEIWFDNESDSVDKKEAMEFLNKACKGKYRKSCLIVKKYKTKSNLTQQDIQLIEISMYQKVLEDSPLGKKLPKDLSKEIEKAFKKNKEIKDKISN